MTIEGAVIREQGVTFAVVVVKPETDGVEVVKVLMTAYQSAEQGKSLPFPPRGIEKFQPQVATGTWRVQ